MQTRFNVEIALQDGEYFVCHNLTATGPYLKPPSVLLEPNDDTGFSMKATITGESQVAGLKGPVQVIVTAASRQTPRRRCANR